MPRYRQIPPVWQVNPVAVQSTHSTPPIPQAVAVVPLLQFKPVSQHPAHSGHGPLPPEVDEDVDVELVVDEDVELDLDDEDVVDRELDVELGLACDDVPEGGVAVVAVAPPVDPVLLSPEAMEFVRDPLLP